MPNLGRAGAILSAAGLVAVAGVVGLVMLLWPGSMPRRDAEVALQRLLKSPYRFHCERVHNDGTIALDDVDYWCIRPARRDLPGYWISTDAHHITGTLPSG